MKDLWGKGKKEKIRDPCTQKVTGLNPIFFVFKHKPAVFIFSHVGTRNVIAGRVHPPPLLLFLSPLSVNLLLPFSLHPLYVTLSFLLHPFCGNPFMGLFPQPLLNLPISFLHNFSISPFLPSHPSSGNIHLFPPALLNLPSFPHPSISVLFLTHNPLQKISPSFPQLQEVAAGPLEAALLADSSGLTIGNHLW